MITGAVATGTGHTTGSGFFLTHFTDFGRITVKRLICTSLGVAVATTVFFRKLLDSRAFCSNSVVNVLFIANAIAPVSDMLLCVSLYYFFLLNGARVVET